MTCRFVLALENSLCEDYVTEKLFKLFAPDTPVVPVVRGGADYTLFPHGALVHAHAHTPPAALAAALRRLGRSREAYAAALTAKLSYTAMPLHDTRRRLACDLCRHLNTRDPLHTQTLDTRGWVRDQCTVLP